MLTGIRFDAIGLVRIIRYHGGDQPRRRNTEARASGEDAPLPVAPTPAKRSRIPPAAFVSLDGELLTRLEVQTVLRCSHSQFYDLVKAGELEKRQTKAGVRITTESVKAVLAGNSQA